jgi:hypothetical protein
MSERRHEHERLDLRAGDLDQALPEVDLQLPTQRRLEPRCRQRFGLQRLPIWLNRPLQRPEADGGALLGDEILPHHVGVAAMADGAPHRPRPSRRRARQ